MRVDFRHTERYVKEVGATRAEAKAETREALLAAGIREISERGIDAPSLDSICARAGFTRGAFYVHFRDRDDFLVAAMERFLGVLLDAVIARDEGAHDLEATVNRFAGVLGMRPDGTVAFHRLLEVCERAPDFQSRFVALLQGAVDRIATAADEGLSAGALRSDLDPRATAQLLVGLALGAISAAEAGLELDVPAVRDTVLRLLRNA
jgi:TetR/AcrR family transcriptional repressor of nem operon